MSRKQAKANHSNSFESPAATLVRCPTATLINLVEQPDEKYHLLNLYRNLPQVQYTVYCISGNGITQQYLSFILNVTLT